MLQRGQGEVILTGLGLVSTSCKIEHSTGVQNRLSQNSTSVQNMLSQNSTGVQKQNMLSQNSTGVQNRLSQNSTGEQNRLSQNSTGVQNWLVQVYRIGYHSMVQVTWPRTTFWRPSSWPRWLTECAWRRRGGSVMVRVGPSGISW